MEESQSIQLGDKVKVKNTNIKGRVVYIIGEKIGIETDGIMKRFDKSSLIKGEENGAQT